MKQDQIKTAFQMDPLEGIQIDGDSSFALALEAQRRGHELWHYRPEDMRYDEGRVMALAHQMELRREHGNHVTLGEPVDLDLSTMDVIQMRQDPPFDMAYITATHLLELIMDDVLIVNDPVEVRNAPEKLFVAKFHELMPPTMITRRIEDIQDYRERHGEIIVKPLYGMGGAGVFHLRSDDANLASLHEMFTAASREPVMVQKFLPEVREGDKRIILVDGEAKGVLNRIPAKGQVRSNLAVGGRAEFIELSGRDREICEILGPELKRRNLIFVGIDVIGDWLTEINVTSPTGLRAIEKMTGLALEKDIWDAVESRLS